MNRSLKLPHYTWLIASIAISMALLNFMHNPGFYPNLRIETSDGMKFFYLNDIQESKTNCEATLTKMESAIKALCQDCRTITRQCQSSLPLSATHYFNGNPVAYPIAYLPKGVLVFETSNNEIGEKICFATTSELKRLLPNAQANCYAAETQRPGFRAQDTKISFSWLVLSGLILIIALLSSKLTAYLIIRYEHLHARYSHDHTHAGPQKFHAFPTPRIGGLPLMIGLFSAALLLQTQSHFIGEKEFGLLLVCALPVFIGGLTEDITKKVGVRERLILSMVSGLFGCWLLGATLLKIDLPGLAPIVFWPIFAIVFTTFAVGGVANALNIIDGYNGLAAGFGVIASTTLGIAAIIYGDQFLFFANAAMAGALLGFLIWNWPHGKIFLGDGGAYLLGFWLAEMCILLVLRNPGVSVWLPLTIMIYPVFETLFSIYRRKFKHKSNPGDPDANHLHQMIYKRLVRIHVGSKNPYHKVKRNSRVAAYFWIFTATFSGIALVFHNNNALLIATLITFCVCYVLLYQRLKTWVVPKGLILRNK